MAIVVGYVPTKEGRAALRRAFEECLLRRTKLIVINSSRGGKDFDATEARRFEDQLAVGLGQLDPAHDQPGADVVGFTPGGKRLGDFGVGDQALFVFVPDRVRVGVPRALEPGLRRWVLVMAVLCS